MTVIRATCPRCGDVALSQFDVTLTIVLPLYDRSTYRFDCPGCQETVIKSAEPEVVDLLKSGGVQVEEIRIPAEALERHDGPPLTWDDLLDLMLDTSSLPLTRE